MHKDDRTCHTRTRVHACVHPRRSRSPPSRQRDVQDEDSVVHYHLFSAPWAVLRYYAEDLYLKLPLQVPRARRGQRGPGGPPQPGSLMTALQFPGAATSADDPGGSPLRVPEGPCQHPHPTPASSTVLLEALWPSRVRGGAPMVGSGEGRAVRTAAKALSRPPGPPSRPGPSPGLLLRASPPGRGTGWRGSGSQVTSG